MPLNSPISRGSYVPTTNIWDVTNLYSIDVNSPAFKELLVRLYQNLSLMASVVNTKESAIYPQQEFVTGGIVPFSTLNPNTQQNRPIFRFYYEANVLAAGATSIPLGFTVGSTWRFMSISGAATNQTTGNHYPLPYVDAAGVANIELRATNTTIEINNNSGQTFLGLVIILEYMKQV